MGIPKIAGPGKWKNMDEFTGPNSWFNFHPYLKMSGAGRWGCVLFRGVFRFGGIRLRPRSPKKNHHSVKSPSGFVGCQAVRVSGRCLFFLFLSRQDLFMPILGSVFGTSMVYLWSPKPTKVPAKNGPNSSQPPKKRSQLAPSLCDMLKMTLYL